ncbi:MAG: 2-oxoglutarate ferredoxin oxidoreductase subunit alpha, partial [Elusimicrobiota bacterium]|nr:2-oxoglutarate ferredoxin oxidoreductase subunit alpha [Elusimicrobiota bacterium]
ISYDPQNHEVMTKMRADKISRVVKEIPPTKINGPAEGELLVVGWGSTYGAITTAITEARKTGLKVSSIHIKHIFPMPADLGAIMRRFRKVLVPEENSGQFRMLLRSTYMIEPLGLNKVQGQPLNSDEILCKIQEILRGN